VVVACEDEVTVTFERQLGNEVAPANLEEYCDENEISTYSYEPSVLEFADV
jgi:hypothetical protein